MNADAVVHYMNHTGLVQTLHRLFTKHMPRDAANEAEQLLDRTILRTIELAQDDGGRPER